MVRIAASKRCWLPLVVCAFLQFTLLPLCGFAIEQFGYTSLRNLIRSGKTSEIQKVIITNGSPRIAVQLAGSDEIRSVLIPSETRAKLITDLDQAGVNIEVHDEDRSGVWFSLVNSFVLPILLLVGFIFMFRSAQGAPRRG